MINIITKDFEVSHAHKEIIRTFLNYKKLEEYEEEVTLYLWYEGNFSCARWVSDDSDITEKLPIYHDDRIKSMKITIYNVLKKIFNKKLPWGSLTGIRPVAYLEENINRLGEEEAKNAFLNLYDVDYDKYSITKSILERQKDILKLRDNKYIVYLHIPFCPTKCKYCSFATMTMDRKGKFIDKYVDTLIKELDEGHDLFNEDDAVSIYIGGGTPSTLSNEHITRLCERLNHYYKNIKEFTFEAGRPDTINDSILKTLSESKVDRISINPQTLKEETLINIGRGHSTKEVYDAFNMAKKYNLDINTDMILGFKGETTDDVLNTVRELIKLDPDNITVHSLAIKNGSVFKEENLRLYDELKIQTDLVYDILTRNNYFPYYLYRQRRQVGEGENIGYTKNGKENIFNVLSMDDKVNVLGFGMGAVSKFVDKNNDIIRVTGYRDLDHYLENYKKVLQNKLEARDLIDKNNHQ